MRTHLVRRWAILAITLTLAAPVRARTPGVAGPESPPDFQGPGAVLTAGRVHMKITNGGITGNPFPHLSSDPSARWPGPSGVEYLNSILFAVAAVDPTQPDTSASRHRVSYSAEWGPASASAEDRIYATAEGGPNGEAYANDDGDLDPVLGTPRVDEDFLDGRDNDGDGAIDEDHATRGQQTFSLAMRDDGPYSGNPPAHRPLNLECRERAWAYTLDGLGDFNVVEYTVINRSGHTLDSLTLGWRVDADLGPASDAFFHADDRDLPGVPSGEWIRVLEAGDVRRQHPHSPQLNVEVPPDSALCPRLPVRVHGFSFADDDGDGGATGGIATFLLVGHTIDPLGAAGPRRVGFQAFRRFLSGTPFAAGGNPANDAERFQLMTSAEGVDAVTGFIDVAPSGIAGDQVAWCSVGPFRHVPDGGVVQATIAYLVQPGGYADAEDFEADRAAAAAGAMSGAALLAKHRSLAGALDVHRLYEGVFVPPSFSGQSGDFHGRETPLRAAPGEPAFFAADCRDEGAGNVRVVNDQGPSWFDLDCDYCTGVWDHASFPASPERFQARWTPFAPTLAVDPRAVDASALRVRITGVTPLPMRDAGVLAFQLPAAGPARIEVRDLAGRLVRRVAERAFVAGPTRVTWDGRDDAGRPAPSGVYFWRVRLGDEEASTPVLVVR
jgi:hypothetical protein